MTDINLPALKAAVEWAEGNPCPCGCDSYVSLASATKTAVLALIERLERAEAVNARAGGTMTPKPPEGCAHDCAVCLDCGAPHVCRGDAALRARVAELEQQAVESHARHEASYRECVERANVVADGALALSRERDALKQQVATLADALEFADQRLDDMGLSSSGTTRDRIRAALRAAGRKT